MACLLVCAAGALRWGVAIDVLAARPDWPLPKLRMVPTGSLSRLNFAGHRIEDFSSRQRGVSGGGGPSSK
jgi:hypothetical protein